MAKTFSILFFSFLLALNIHASEKYDDEFSEFDYEFAQEEKEVQKKQESDPLSGYNRVMTDINDGLYTYALRPVFKGYDAIVHDNIQEGIANVFNNSTFPIRFVNSILQLKFDKAVIETGRFIINTTLGVFGIFDVAKNQFNLVTTAEDFGQTLGHYGVGSGWHIVLPIFGPSNMRDMFSMFPDIYLNPSTYVSSRSDTFVAHPDHAWALFVGERLNSGSMNYSQYDLIRKDAIDLYPYLKNMYEQHRVQKIKE
ncbi:MAG: VacJ family lipoprotein [Campylobacterota bacterium]|nr:VacJ family lipoprotein [Campylobacterota bacterium]